MAKHLVKLLKLFHVTSHTAYTIMKRVLIKVNTMPPNSNNTRFSLCIKKY